MHKEKKTKIISNGSIITKHPLINIFIYFIIFPLYKFWALYSRHSPSFPVSSSLFLFSFSYVLEFFYELKRHIKSPLKHRSYRFLCFDLSKSICSFLPELSSI
jgi:hypothetical protein